jgi:hypothetical protein
MKTKMRRDMMRRDTLVRKEKREKKKRKKKSSRRRNLLDLRLDMFLRSNLNSHSLCFRLLDNLFLHLL